MIFMIISVLTETRVLRGSIEAAQGYIYTYC